MGNLLQHIFERFQYGQKYNIIYDHMNIRTKSSKAIAITHISYISVYVCIYICMYIYSMVMMNYIISGVFIIPQANEIQR